MLGAAVLRHGTAAWDDVAGELRSRTHFPALYTHQVCEVRYEEIQERYSGSDTWFEELRKERIAQLRRELEAAGVSVESLLSKSESRNSESSDYNTSRTESPVHIEKAEGLDSSSKEACRDESSAGSYMGDTNRNWLQENRVSPSASSGENDRKEDLNDCSRNATWRAFDITQGIARKKRGQRKRKCSTIVKEESAEESSMMTVDVEVPPQEEMTLPCNSTREANENCEHSSLILNGIMDSMMKHEGISFFARRLETQKRARYKKMIRQHVDLRNVRLRIGDGSISTAKELFRDLLLIASNAIVFYPKSSPEHESGIVLRGLVTQALHDHLCSRVSGDGSAAVPAEVKSEMIEPQGLQACRGKTPGSPGSEDGKKKGAESLSRKRVIGSRAVKGRLGNGKRGREDTEKERKRARRR